MIVGSGARRTHSGSVRSRKASRDECSQLRFVWTKADGCKRVANGNVHAATVIGLALALTFLVADAEGQPGDTASSLLLLIDSSGSMGDEIGGSNHQIKIDVAKDAAVAALGRATRSGAVEVAVLAFSGDCATPVPRFLGFTRDADRLSAFIRDLQPGGGTPMADALTFANRFMDRNAHRGASDRMIVLLADGQNDCGDVGHSMAALRASGTVFRHETVGFGITPNSPAAQDLRRIATETGGMYHHAADAAQLADVLMESMSTFTIIDLLGQFSAGASANGIPRSATGDGQAPARVGDLVGLLGGPRGKKREPGSAGSHGALAIDSKQGTSWGWAIDYPTASAATERALSECGNGCSIIMSFADECAAFAADQATGSTANGWAKGHGSGGDARARALAECANRGGNSCIVRAWGCTRRR